MLSDVEMLSGARLSLPGSAAVAARGAGTLRSGSPLINPVHVLVAVRAMEVGLLLAASGAQLSVDRTERFGPIAALLLCLVATYAAAATLAALGGYTYGALRSPGRAAFAAMPAGLAAGAAHWLAASTLMGDPAPLTPSLHFGLPCLGLLLAGRLLLCRTVLAWRASSRLGLRVALLGTSEPASRLHHEIDRAPGSLARVDGVYALDGEGEPCSARVAGGIDRLIEDGRHRRFDAVLIAPPRTPDAAELDALVARLGSVVSDIYLAAPGATRGTVPAGGASPVLPASAGRPVSLRPIGGPDALRKRCFDLLLATLLLLALSPLLLMVAGLVRLTSAGPVLFRQPRTGFNNRPFVALKFRTMRVAEADPAGSRQTLRDDPRVTPVGRWLRRFSIDELPQLINVLRGEMSLVGPRPHATGTRSGGQLLADAHAAYASRHRVRPGITGWAQVNGYRGAVDSLDHLERRVAHDLHYIRHWSLAFDLRILALTVAREIRSKHAC